MASVFQVFTGHYGQLMHDFIPDDHDHSHSVTSFSIQLFAFPTLAQYLMAHHDSLAALLVVFLVEIERRKNIGNLQFALWRSCFWLRVLFRAEGRLSFDGSQNQSSCWRAMHVLYDIKYLLSAVPLPEATQPTGDKMVSDESTSGRWSEPLRKGFLHGFQMTLSLLASMEVTFFTFITRTAWFKLFLPLWLAGNGQCLQTDRAARSKPNRKLF